MVKKFIQISLHALGLVMVSVKMCCVVWILNIDKKLYVFFIAIACTYFEFVVIIRYLKPVEELIDIKSDKLGWLYN